MYLYNKTYSMFVFKKSKNCMRRPRPVASVNADFDVEQKKTVEQKQPSKPKSQAKKSQAAKEEVQLEDNEIKSE